MPPRPESPVQRCALPIEEQKCTLPVSERGAISGNANGLPAGLLVRRLTFHGGPPALPASVPINPEDTPSRRVKPGRGPSRTTHLSSALGARSSVGERSLHTREVAGSKPAAPIAEMPANAVVSRWPKLASRTRAQAEKRPSARFCPNRHSDVRKTPCSIERVSRPAGAGQHT